MLKLHTARSAAPETKVSRSAKASPMLGRVSGDRRFRRPAELQPWPGVRDALHLGVPAIHISAFGGDPNNVMIFGESGGGAKTSCLYAIPAAAPYFNKASIESGPGVRMLTREMAAETTALVLQALNIAPNEWRKLLDVPAAELLRVQSHFPPVPPHQRRKTA